MKFLWPFDEISLLDQKKVTTALPNKQTYYFILLLFFDIATLILNIRSDSLKLLNNLRGLLKH